MQVIESEQIKEHQEKLLAWQESEKNSIEQWEKAEKMRLVEWETNEISRQTAYATDNAQNRANSQLRIEQQKQKRMIWMIFMDKFCCLVFCLVSNWFVCKSRRYFGYFWISERNDIEHFLNYCVHLFHCELQHRYKTFT
ncbi:MAG: hypothetical protein C0410_04235 [Anaerolinea sp.]|nr:hypothetical protein [Anaerolinea sp.]